MVIGLVSQKYLHLLVLHFPPLVVTTNPGGGETGLIQTVVADSVCSVPGRDTVVSVDAGAGMVAAICVLLLALHHELCFSDAIR